MVKQTQALLKYPQVCQRMKPQLGQMSAGFKSIQKFFLLVFTKDLVRALECH